MKTPLKLGLGGLAALAVAAAVARGLLSGHTVAVLSPKGIVAQQEFGLMVTVTLLMLIVVIPVFVLTFVIAWKYRAGNTKAKYTPDWDHNRLAETVWWGIPFVLILAISVITWNSSHALDPSKPLASAKPSMTIQVVALDWKWLFIYPEQHIATVNYVQFPKDTPVNFQITSDAPMNSFWIPQLGGQIYAMAGMTTRLNLMASDVGGYRGSSVNLSGRGFAGMNFMAYSTSDADFATWVKATQRSPQALNFTAYTQLAQPSENNPPAAYSLPSGTLYDEVVMKYMSPADMMGHMDMTGTGGL